MPRAPQDGLPRPQRAVPAVAPGGKIDDVTKIVLWSFHIQVLDEACRLVDIGKEAATFHAKLSQVLQRIQPTFQTPSPPSMLANVSGLCDTVRELKEELEIAHDVIRACETKLADCTLPLGGHTLEDKVGALVEAHQDAEIGLRQWRASDRALQSMADVDPAEGKLAAVVKHIQFLFGVDSLSAVLPTVTAAYARYCEHVNAMNALRSLLDMPKAAASEIVTIIQHRLFAQ